MEEFTSEFQKVLKSAGSFSEINSNMVSLSNFSELNQPLSSHFLDHFTSGSFINNLNTAQPPYSTVEGSHQSLLCPFDQINANITQSLRSPEEQFQRHVKNANSMSEFEEVPSSPGFGSDSGANDRTDKNNGAGARKRKRKTEGEGEKPKEVIHVRAKRGQATDSHSLAERVRRERINEKLKVLQDLVPGCYKTMGMAVMLDVIINYVRSLQNQIEFLSMKLSAASMFYDFNSPEAEAIETLQRTTATYETLETERLPREAHGAMLPRLQSVWPF